MVLQSSIGHTAASNVPGGTLQFRAGFNSRGFSFTELLFAVMILGIGFIMIAAIFPVGLTQTKSNFDETIAASAARSAITVIEKESAKDVFNLTGLQPLQTLNNDNTITSKIAHYNMILPSDPRYAWVAFYKTSSSGQSAQIVTLVINRSDPFKRAQDFSVIGTSACRSIEPRQVQAELSVEKTLISAVGGPGDNNLNPAAAGPGAFLVVSEPRLSETNLTVLNAAGSPTTPTPDDVLAANDRLGGSVYRLGSLRSGTEYDWYPGSGFQPETFIYTTAAPANERRTVTVNAMGDALAYIVGRNRIQTGPNTSEFEGAVMDVAYYTSFVTLK